VIAIVVPTLDMAKGQEAGWHAMGAAGVSCRLHVELDRERHGYTKTVNAGLRGVDGDDAVVLVDDCEPSDGWLRALRDAADAWRHMRAWFVGPSGPCRTHPQNGGRPGDYRKPRRVRHLAGFCLYVRWDAIAKGLMDESYIHYASEIDWQRRMQQEHRACSVWVPGVYVGHGLHEPHADWWAHDQALLRERWHSTPGLELTAG